MNMPYYTILLPVHLMGYPNRLDKLTELAQHYELVLFEDAAQAHGTKYQGKNVGSFGYLAAYSFYIAHNIQPGEMGAVVTDDDKLDQWIRKIKANGRTCDCPICTRSQGICPKEDLEALEDNDHRFLHDIVGFNFKTMEFQAGIDRSCRSTVSSLARYSGAFLTNNQHIRTFTIYTKINYPMRIPSEDSASISESTSI